MLFLNQPVHFKIFSVHVNLIRNCYLEYNRQRQEAQEYGSQSGIHFTFKKIFFLGKKVFFELFTQISNVSVRVSQITEDCH